jgi:hypothetical protein
VIDRRSIAPLGSLATSATGLTADSYSVAFC